MTFLTSTRLAIAFIGASCVAAQSIGAEGRAPSGLAPSKVVTGEVAQVKGEFHMAKDPQGELTLDIVDKSYVIKGQSGKELRLELSDDTKVRNRVNPGDMIEAKISSKGQTLSVTRLEP